jgi:uncharacterized protein YdeI (YjbR/CyaY-like superfamily)
MSNPNPSVDGYIRKNQPFAAELQALRAILLDSPLEEHIKWRTPCYTFDGTNVAIMGAGSDHCALSFLKGVLLKDPRGLLVQPGANSQAARLIRFKHLREIEDLTPVIKAFVQEAVEVEKAGLKVEFNAKHELVYPPEFQKKLDENPKLKKAFDALTPGRRRGYNMFFTAAKQSKTRESRVDKCVPRILEGKGLNDD